MSNRHANKKRRAAVRRRMARTGESYQRALQSLLRQSTGPDHAADGDADLVAFTHYGKPTTLFTVCRGELQAFALQHGTGAWTLRWRFIGSQTRSN